VFAVTEKFQLDFKPECNIMLAPWEAGKLLKTIQRISQGTITGGHGAYKLFFTLENGELTFRIDTEYCKLESRVSLESLLDTNVERRLLVFRAREIRVAEIRGGHYYKLVPTVSGSYPTLEINGIHMHRVSGSDPKRDTLTKVRAARVRRGHMVLDTCMGLGYTAIHSMLKGGRVFTVELDSNVIQLARYNPWSWKLADSKITVFHGDVTFLIGEFESGFFDRIIHDPPRLTSTTGSLYGTEFYRELYRVLKRKGILFHYTGEPGRKHGAHFPAKVAGRLRRAGFEIIEYNREAMGIVAIKL
jgi:predicted methyltransferase